MDPTKHNFQIGIGQVPPTYAHPSQISQIAGKEVIWIDDIRNAPGGDKCSLIDKNLLGSILFIKVNAVASDKFTLYLENGSLDGTRPKLIGGSI